MKTIENKTTEIEKGEEKTTYADLAAACIRQPKQGHTYEEMRKAMRVIKAAEAAEDKIELEDADMETLKEAVKAMKWGIIHKDIVEFCDEVMKA